MKTKTISPQKNTVAERRESGRKPSCEVMNSGRFSEKSPFSLRLLFICAVILSVIGIISVFVVVSVSKLTASQGISKVFIQIGATALGIAAMLIISRLPLGVLYGRVWWLFLLLSLALLVLTLKFGGGPGGTKSWITIPGFPVGIQTSELVKPLFIISFAGHLRLAGDRINKPLVLLTLVLHTGAVAGIIVLQHDLGSALVYIFVAAVMCFSSGLRLRWFIAGAGVCSAALPLIWHFLTEYQKKRILVGFNPELDPLGYGYQVILSKDAVISGFPWGSRFLSLEYTPIVPAAHTDMIFSAYAEQFGIVGTAVLFLLYIALVCGLLMSGRHCSETGSAIFSGIAAMLIFQITENIGMCLGILPVIGITLPFISYGGSSVLSLYLSLGIAASVLRSGRELQTK